MQAPTGHISTAAGTRVACDAGSYSSYFDRSGYSGRLQCRLLQSIFQHLRMIGSPAMQAPAVYIAIVSNFQVHQPASYQEVPWRNGLGKTLVLLSEPIPGSEAFAWRLSIAGVASNGPFSRFDDCDRILILLDGKGMTLTHGNGQIDELRARFSQAQFPGDVETIATLHAGPVRDFNVMCHRHHSSAKVTVPGDDGSNRVDVKCDQLLAYAVEGPARALPAPGQSVRIGHHELLQCGDPPRGSWIFSGGPVIVIQIDNIPVDRPRAMRQRKKST